MCYCSRTFYFNVCYKLGFPGGSDGKESACNAGDLCSIPGSGKSPGEGNGYPLQYSGLENSMDCAHGVAKSWTRLRDFHFTSLQTHIRKVFLSEQCKQIEENNRMGKTRDTKGTFQAKMATIRDKRSST